MRNAITGDVQEGDMEISEWCNRYTKRLEGRGLTAREAAMTFEGGITCHDYDDDPEMAADDELSYYDCDEEEPWTTTT